MAKQVRIEFDIRTVAPESEPVLVVYDEMAVFDETIRFHLNNVWVGTYNLQMIRSVVPVLNYFPGRN